MVLPMDAHTTAKVTLHRRSDADDLESYAYYADTPEGRVGVWPDHDGDTGRVTGWMTELVGGNGMTMHRTLIDVREWIARGGR